MGRARLFPPPFRGRFRGGEQGCTTQTPPPPNTRYVYDVKLNPIGYRFQTGQRIRLYISSSDFPNFDRNHDAGNPYHPDVDMVPAHQTIHHSADMPSHIILPIIPS